MIFDLKIALTSYEGKEVEVKLIPGKYDLENRASTTKKIGGFIGNDKEVYCVLEGKLEEYMRKLSNATVLAYIKIKVDHNVDSGCVLHKITITESDSQAYEKSRITYQRIEDEEKAKCRERESEELKVNKRSTQYILSNIINLDKENPNLLRGVETLNDLIDCLQNCESYIMLQTTAKNLVNLNKEADAIFYEVDSMRRKLAYKEFKPFIDKFVEYYINLAGYIILLDGEYHKLVKEEGGIYYYYRRRTLPDSYDEKSSRNDLKRIFINSFIEDSPIEWRQIHLKEKNTISLSDVYTATELKEFNNKLISFKTGYKSVTLAYTDFEAIIDYTKKSLGTTKWQALSGNTNLDKLLNLVRPNNINTDDMNLF